jgi:two-component system response regulator AtoC
MFDEGTDLSWHSGGAYDFRMMATRAARFRISVLILGQTGVGKEVLARRIHQESPRASKPLVAVDCAALSQTIAESELFGNERGAFTSAHQSRAGLLEAADGGTVFFDEVGELPLVTQAKLLRTLETRTVQRVGATSLRHVDVRVLAATNRDLDREVKEGRFRPDLLFRLDGIRLLIPSLNARRDEIPRLASSFVAELSSLEHVPEPALSDDAIALLMAYSWPGNVRELKNVIQRALVLCDGHSIEPRHLLLPKTDPASGADDDAWAQQPDVADPPQWTRRAHRTLARAEIVAALARFGGNQTRAAAFLKISRRSLIYRLDAFGIVRPCKRVPRPSL